MNSLINTKELCKQIRVSGSVIWTMEEKQHFISNRHFLVRFDELPREVTIALFSVFCKLPEVGQTFTAFRGSVNDKAESIKYDNIYQPNKQDVEGSKTAFLRDMGRKALASVIKFPTHVSLVDERYMKLAGDSEMVKTTGKSPHAPLYLANNDLLVLPIRVQGDSDLIDGLIAEEGDLAAEIRS
jgi:hypothetical protein